MGHPSSSRSHERSDWQIVWSLQGLSLNGMDHAHWLVETAASQMSQLLCKVDDAKGYCLHNSVRLHLLFIILTTCPTSSSLPRPISCRDFVSSAYAGGQPGALSMARIKNRSPSSSKHFLPARPRS
jgi:hypothetical protein